MNADKQPKDGIPGSQNRESSPAKSAKTARAPRNRTIVLSPQEQSQYLQRCITVDDLSVHTPQTENPESTNQDAVDNNLATTKVPERDVSTNTKVPVESITDKTIAGDFHSAAEYLPDAFIDLLFVDPPYNLYKKFNSSRFNPRSNSEYKELLESWFTRLIPLLKPSASVYVCTDWRSTAEVVEVLNRHFTVRNRITWEREKGRGAKHNWKNSAEDIWFATVSNDYYFNVDAVKLKRRVMAPYRDNRGKPKDWYTTNSGSFRLTHPSNLWTDITVPYWSMPENTDHPTQKPEKLLAKIILASSRAGEMVFDPFLGSGTTSVVAKKLGRSYCGIEREPEYAALSEKRLELAGQNRRIQGYEGGIFYERNSLP